MPMHTLRCNRCKQPFAFEGLPPPCCPRCQKIKDAQFQLVRNLVKGNPGISAAEVHEHTEVPLSAIMKYVENGDLEVMPAKDGDKNRELVWPAKSRLISKPLQTGENDFEENDADESSFEADSRKNRTQLNFQFDTPENE